MSGTRGFRAIITAGLLLAFVSGATADGGDVGSPAAHAAIGTYVFLPKQSTLVQIGGIAGVHWTYSVAGQFRLTIDRDAKTASFAHVDANATDATSPQRTLDPNQVFYLTLLAGTTVDDKTISFTGKAPDGSSIRITMTLQEALVHLVGQTTPPPGGRDFFSFSLDAVAQRKYSGGTGEPNDPYQITTAADLIALGEIPADYDKHFILTADIDLDPNLPGRKVFDDAVIAPLHTWSRGSPTHLFNGVFDGHNHTIRHLTIAGSGWFGLFGGLDEGGVIVNLALEAVNVNAAAGDAGSLVGWNEYGSIMNCSSAGVVRGHGTVGGLVGQNSGNVSNCYSTCAVIGDQRAGGLVGANDHGYGFITDCYSAGSVSGKSKTGGLLGENAYGNTASSFWDTQTSGRAISAGGLGLTTAQMQDVGTYLSAGWDFFEESANGTCDWWQMSPGGYPKLRYLAGAKPVMPEGVGTAEKPYLIRNAGDLGTVWFEPQACYRLEASIDLTGMSWSTAVIPCFGGILDANGHALRGLRVRGGNYVGLIGRLAPGATVSHLRLEVADVNALGDHVGGLVGWSYGKIINCHVDGTVTGREWGVGGLVGWNLGSVTDSHNAAAVSGQAYVGGVAGINWFSAGAITNSSNAGAVNAGGYVGGLVGWNFSSIRNSYNTGMIHGGTDVGGLVGNHGNLGSITNCYSTGIVSGSTPYLGGLIGNDNGGAVSASFWDIHTSGLMTGRSGTGKTTAEMKTARTFLDAGWDFVGETKNGTADVWWIDEGRDYPRLWWEAAPK